MESCINDGVSFTQETTLSGHRAWAAARRAKEAGYYIRLYYIGLDTAEESKRRIANRVARGGHNVNAEDVERRFLGRWDAVRAVFSPIVTKRPSMTTTMALWRLLTTAMGS